MKTQYTDLQLKIALTKELPELIFAYYKSDHDNYTPEYWHFEWRNGGTPISFREWDWIVRECEKKISPTVRRDYIANLWEIQGNERSVNFWTEYNFRGFYSCVAATWQQRAIAYFKTINKEI